MLATRILKNRFLNIMPVFFFLVHPQYLPMTVGFPNSLKTWLGGGGVDHVLKPEVVECFLIR